jgi:pentatricopeptide repeat protein
MKAAGLIPAINLFNSLLEEIIAAGGDCWRIVNESESLGVVPDLSTCSILLGPAAKPEHVKKIITFASQLNDVSDIFGPLLDACLRTDNIKLMQPYLKRQLGPDRIHVKDAITYAHLVRAYGRLEDVDGAWHAWKEMMSRNILPLRVTVGCMVQALVSNKRSEAGYSLVRDLFGNPRTSSLVSSITYNSLLKGFGCERQFDRVWTVYSEIKEKNIDLTITTFNTVIDACARCNHMEQIETILNDMATNGLEPDHITYNTIIKGLCHDRRLEQALEMRDKMRSSSTMVVDGHAYGALLDGCSRLGKWQKGFELLDEMLADKVVPNNITITAVVRLAGFSKHPWALDRAFEICEQYPKKFGFRLNEHVYKNLCLACVSHNDYERAIDVVARAALAGHLDVTMYEPVLSALATKRQMLADVNAMVRLAAGLRVARSQVPVALRDVPVASLRVYGARMQSLVERTLVSMAAIDQSLAVPLARELERDAGLVFSGRSKMQLASSASSP